MQESIYNLLTKLSCFGALYAMIVCDLFCSRTASANANDSNKLNWSCNADRVLCYVRLLPSLGNFDNTAV